MLARTCTLLTLACLGGTSFAAEKTPSMLKDSTQFAAVPYPGARILEIDAGKLARAKDLAANGAFTLTDLPLADGTLVDVNLKPIKVLADDALVRVASLDKNGVQYEAVETPEFLILGGTLAGDPDSVVMLAIHDGRAEGLIRSGGSLQFISSGRLDDNLPPMIYDTKELPDGLIDANPFECETPDKPREHNAAAPEGGGVAGGSGSCRRIEIAIDVDFELLDGAFGGSTLQALFYVMKLVAAQNELYKRDVGFGWLISDLTMWDTASNPWSGSTTAQQVNQYQDWYQVNGTSIDRDVAHFLTSRSIGGGRAAAVGGLCNDDGYAVSGSMSGSFPYPLEAYNSQNWDIIVFAHENGHLCNGSHTHAYSPPLDDCNSGGCTDAANGSLMSYCHLCAGGLANFSMEFHPTVASDVRDYLDAASCIGTVSTGVTAYDDDAETTMNHSVVIDILDNDVTQCNDPTLAGWETNGDNGGSISLSYASGPFGRHELIYTPPFNFTGMDRFMYMVNDSDALDYGLVEITIILSHTPGDLNGDGFVNGADLGLMLAEFGGDPVHADLDGDGDVDGGDMGILLANWTG